MAALRRARQQLLSFLLRHGRVYTGRTPWSKAHSSWLCGQPFEHPAHQIVLAEYRHAIEEAKVRLKRLTGQVMETAASWSMAPVVQAAPDEHTENAVSNPRIRACYSNRRLEALSPILRSSYTLFYSALQSGKVEL
jgi:hypothetical protein